VLSKQKFQEMQQHYFHDFNITASSPAVFQNCVELLKEVERLTHVAEFQEAFAAGYKKDVSWLHSQLKMLKTTSQRPGYDWGEIARHPRRCVIAERKRPRQLNGIPAVSSRSLMIFKTSSSSVMGPFVVTLACALTVVDRLRTLRSNMLKELNGQTLLIRQNGR
jgi:hypothetical protein